ncbi:hypothetical protein PR048_001923 [Dryococelus australis]|uniref:Peptidase A2 domain-containing protein n=1 Tax=Dryococelus australis TaxID=614101 RepID=A0ABQ9IIV7_9NEOP|nr:hypothetical protein PR048_001923 [Dryococelus australis]
MTAAKWLLNQFQFIKYPRLNHSVLKEKIGKSRIARFRCASGLSNEEEETQVNALVYLIGDKAEIILISGRLMLLNILLRRESQSRHSLTIYIPSVEIVISLQPIKTRLSGIKSLLVLRTEVFQTQNIFHPSHQTVVADQVFTRKTNSLGYENSPVKQIPKNCYWCGNSSTHVSGLTVQGGMCFAGHVTKKDTLLDDVQAGAIDFVRSCNKWIAQVTFCGVNLEAQTDTGGNVCVLPESLYKKKFYNLKLMTSDKMLIGPNGLNLNILGTVLRTLKYKGLARLSNLTSEHLGLVNKISNMNSKSFDPVHSFPKLFNGLRKTKISYNIKLKDGAVTFPFTTPRQVSLPLKKLKIELDKMVASGVIEKVETPTEWCAALVIVPKSNGKNSNLH